MRTLLAFAALALLAAPAAPAAAQDADQAAIDLAIERGRLIYAYDQAAWHGTDDMMVKIKDPAAVLGGWIVDGPADAPELVFFDKAGRQAVYVARFRDNKLISSRVLGEGDDRSLTPARLALIAARKAALEKLAAEGARSCTKSAFNTVVLPPAHGGPTLVYFLTPQVANREYPLGGHFRVEVGSDGKAGTLRPFTRTCLNMAAPANVAALTVSHLLDPVPTEVHVFTSLTSAMPVYVITTENKRLWRVENKGGRTRIGIVEQPSP